MEVCMTVSGVMVRVGCDGEGRVWRCDIAGCDTVWGVMVGVCVLNRSTHGHMAVEMITFTCCVHMCWCLSTVLVYLKA